MKNLLALKNIVLIGFVLIVVVIFAVIKIPQDNTPVSPTPKTNEQSAPPPFVAAAGPSPSSTAPTALKSKTQTAPAPATLPNTPQADTTDDCGSNFDCYQAYYQNQVKAFGVVAAFDKLKEQYPQNAYVQSQCHPLTNVIGQSAILLYESVSQAFSNGDGFCWSG